MAIKVLATSVLLMGTLLVVYLAADVLETWSAYADHQGRLIKHHWVDRPEVGEIA